jgi:hypothetical protein
VPVDCRSESPAQQTGRDTRAFSGFVNLLTAPARDTKGPQQADANVFDQLFGGGNSAHADTGRRHTFDLCFVSPSLEWQPAHTNGCAVSGYSRSGLERGFTAVVYELDQISLPLSIHHLLTEQDHGRISATHHCEVGMEVVVQGNADSLLACSPKEDCDIFSPVHSNLGNMDGVELAFAKNGRSSRCKSLVQ